MTILTFPVPLRDDGDGGLRIGRTRVQLESVVALHQQGQTAEQIVAAFDTLDLADVYAVLSWVLRHPDEVQAYLKRRDDEAEEVWRKLEASGVGKRLTSQDLEAMKARRGPGHVPPAQ